MVDSQRFCSLFYSTEQEDLIAGLRDENLASNQQYLLVLQVTVALSCLLWALTTSPRLYTLIRTTVRHLIFLVNPTNPLLVLFSSKQPDTPIPLLLPFTLLAVLIHLDLGLLLYPDRSRLTDVAPLSYLPLFGLSALSPFLSILLGRHWLTVAWWSVTGGVVWLAHSVQRWINQGAQSILELEKMKYVAPGAWQMDFFLCICVWNAGLCVWQTNPGRSSLSLSPEYHPGITVAILESKVFLFASPASLVNVPSHLDYRFTDMYARDHALMAGCWTLTLWQSE